MAESREVSESDRAPGRQRHRAGGEPDGDSLRKDLEKLSLEGGKRPHREWWKSEDFLRETTEEERELWAELERQREEDHKLQGEFRDLVRRKDEITCAMWRTRERIRIMYQHKGGTEEERRAREWYDKAQGGADRSSSGPGSTKRKAREGPGSD